VAGWENKMANVVQTAQRVTFTSIATILIPLGIGMIVANNFWAGLITVVVGIGALVAREMFKSVWVCCLR